MSTDEYLADYDVRSPAARTLMTVLGTILAVGILVGLVLGASILKRNTTVTTSDIELVDASPIVIDAGAADLRIVQGDPDIVRVKGRVTSGLRKTDFQVGRRGNQIKIVSGCQTWLSPGCGVETTLELPEGFPVEVRTTSGNVEVREIVEGVLTIKSSTGNINGSGLELDELFAQTTSGEISADFATQPFAFKATTTSGNISADMPDGKKTYVVTATSKSGSVSSEMKSEKNAEGFVRAVTNSGNIVLRTK